MLTILNQPHKLMAPAKAEELAATLNEDADENEEYRANHDPKGTGLSFVEILVDGEVVFQI